MRTQRNIANIATQHNPADDLTTRGADLADKLVFLCATCVASPIIITLLLKAA